MVSLYNFVMPHKSLRQGRTRRTPAMAIGLTDHVWSGVGHMTVDTCGKPYLPTLHTAFKAHIMSAEARDRVRKVGARTWLYAWRSFLRAVVGICATAHHRARSTPAGVRQKASWRRGARSRRAADGACGHRDTDSGRLTPGDTRCAAALRKSRWRHAAVRGHVLHRGKNAAHGQSHSD